MNEDGLLGGGSDDWMKGVRFGRSTSRRLGVQGTKLGELKRQQQIAISSDPSREKKAWKRAKNKALKFGFSAYKGRAVHCAPGQTAALRRREITPPSGPRCRLVSWNAGGLSDTVRAEVEALCQSEPAPDILCTQETHWNFSGTWKRNGWTYFHSAMAKRNQGGVMTAIRSDLLDHESSSWSELVPGHYSGFALPSGGSNGTLLTCISFPMLAWMGKPRNIDYRNVKPSGTS